MKQTPFRQRTYEGNAKIEVEGELSIDLLHVVVLLLQSSLH